MLVLKEPRYPGGRRTRPICGRNSGRDL